MAGPFVIFSGKVTLRIIYSHLSRKLAIVSYISALLVKRSIFVSFSISLRKLAQLVDLSHTTTIPVRNDPKVPIRI